MEPLAPDEVIVTDEPHPVLHPPILGQEELWYWKDGIEKSHGSFTTGEMIQIRIRETFTGSTKIKINDRASFVSLWKYFPSVANAFELPARVERNMMCQWLGSTKLAFLNAISSVKCCRLV